MVSLPSFNYQAINAPGGIAAGLGGLTAALIDASTERRRMRAADEERAYRRSVGEQDLLMRRTALEDAAANRKAIAERDARDYEREVLTSDRDYELAKQNAATLGAQRVGNAVQDFQKGGGLLGMLMGAPRTGGRAPNPNDDVIPSHLLSNIEKQLDDQDAAMKAQGGLMGTGMLPHVRANARQKALQNAGYDPLTMRRLAPGNTNAAGQKVSPQQNPTPSAQPSAAPNQNPGMSDADILQLKAKHPQYATIPDDEFIRRVRAKTQGK